MRILIVEDEPLIALDLADSLERGGHEVAGPAATAAEALALCEAGQRPRLALVDIDLRGGGNGVVLARALVARWRVAVIFVSGEREEAQSARDVALGYIRKPLEADTALRGVEAARAVLDGGKPTSVPAGFELFVSAPE
jgi:DNA-binding response OmpR family regulator